MILVMILVVSVVDGCGDVLVVVSIVSGGGGVSGVKNG